MAARPKSILGLPSAPQGQNNTRWIKEYGGRLCKAARAANGSEVLSLLDMGVPPDVLDELGMTPLMLCCMDDGHDQFGGGRGKEDSLMIAEALIKKGADIHAKGPGDWTALFYAAFYADGEVMELLLNHGADIWAPDECGLHIDMWIRYGDQDKEHQKASLKMIYKLGWPQPVEVRAKAGELSVEFFSPMKLDNLASQSLQRSSQVRKHFGQ
ncbi:unnamed protein product [Polarella glacialis]|uniref:Ankyrin repeat domain-containing protein n=1 Tax=Polarella glacialis TaxID=89957 RepID=A0A813FK48_POLGL|nr:unnamed protein product [Polarella glacialis]